MKKLLMVCAVLLMTIWMLAVPSLAEENADFVIDHTILSGEPDIIKNKMYESDADIFTKHSCSFCNFLHFSKQ